MSSPCQTWQTTALAAPGVAPMGTPLGTATLDANATASITVSNLPIGLNTVYAEYSGDAVHSASTSLVANITVVGLTEVTSVDRYGYHAQPTFLVINFDNALDPTSAQDTANYTIIGPAGNRIKVGSAVYDPDTNIVTLKPVSRLNLHWHYKLTINGTTSSGLKNPSGELLDGAGNGQPGSNYVTTLGWKNLAGRANQRPDPPPTRAPG